jgi:hypothetical protein
LAKFVGGVGNAPILQIRDPIVGLRFGHLMIAAATLELAVAICCFLSKNLTLPLIFIAWIGTSFLIYRVGLHSIGWQSPCSCLGNLTDAIHVSSQLADNIMKGILAYLLIGSYAILFWLWRQKRQMLLTFQPCKVKGPDI